MFILSFIFLFLVTENPAEKFINGKLGILLAHFKVEEFDKVVKKN